MKMIIAPDSFKGTFTSKEIIEKIKTAANRHFDQPNIVEIPIADGGEGTVDAIMSCVKGELIKCVVKDPLGRDIDAVFGLYNKTAVIEMAAASGIILLTDEEKNPLMTTTYGTGQLIKEALTYGVEEIIIGIGGSATNDGGIGMAQALGAKFYDHNHKELDGVGASLSKINEIDISHLDKRLKDVKVTVICDVNNPLTGPEGATYIYGPQKGATKDIKESLEAGMINYHHVIQRQFNIDLNSIDGTGAAGGLGAGLIIYLNGTLKPGIETILDLVQFDNLLENTDLVITGEGRLDSQSINGKVPVGVAKRCINHPSKVIVLAGSTSNDCEVVYDYGVDAIFSTVTEPTSLDYVLKHAEILLENAINRMFRTLKVGMQIYKN